MCTDSQRYMHIARCTQHTADAEENQYSCEKEANVLYAPVFGQSKTAIGDSYQQLIIVLDKSRTGIQAG